jgi:hypothetical protein
MKFNKWTVGLAAVGAVSLASIAQADEKASSVMTAVSSTTLSGYVDTSMEWNPGTGTHQPNYAFQSGKQDGFNLDAVDVRLSKPMDESEWAAGYMVDIYTGSQNGPSDTQATGSIIRQAYVNLRTPVGNGIDWKVGLFDNIIGYESTDAPNDPNFTRSYGYTMLARELTGITATYKFSELISATVGVADTLDLTANSRAFPPEAESYKAYVGAITLTAPNDWGFISGSSLYAGFNNGFATQAAAPGTVATGAPTTALYIGATLNTPITGMKLGAAYEYVDTQAQNFTGGPGVQGSLPQTWADDIAGYVSYQATEKLSFHGRAEILWETKAQLLPPSIAAGTGYVGPIVGPDKIMSYTATVQYDLWKNVLSRLELRWDHDLTGGDPVKYYGANRPLGGGVANINGVTTQGSLVNSWVLAANIVYKF